MDLRRQTLSTRARITALVAALAACTVALQVPAQAGALPSRPAGTARDGGDDPMGHVKWMQERMEGHMDAALSSLVISQATKERGKYPSKFQSAGGSFNPGAHAWQCLGPTTDGIDQTQTNGIDSGRARTILVDPADPTGNTVYYLNAGGGLWKTTSFLAAPPAWTPLTDAVGSTAGGSVAFGRASSTLYLGIGDPFDANVGGFVITSQDGGGSWGAPTQLGSAQAVMDVKVDTSAAADIVLAGTDNGLWRSADGGSTWSQVPSIPPTDQVWSLVRSQAGWLALGVDGLSGSAIGTLYLSTDQGATWTPVNAPALAPVGRSTLAVGAPGDAVVYLFAANQNLNASDQQDLYRSTDGGRTWTALGLGGSKPPLNPNNVQPGTDFMNDQAWYNQMVLVDPSDASRNTVYVGGNLASGMTTDGGNTWKVITDWLPGLDDPSTSSLPYVHADFHAAAAFDAGGKHYVCFGTDGGVFVSTNVLTQGPAASWDSSKNQGLATHLIYALAVNPALPGSALVGMQDNGTRLRDAQNPTSFNEVQGGDGFGVGWSQAPGVPAPGIALASYYNENISLNTQDPANLNDWIPFTSGLDTFNGGFYFVTPIVTPAATADPNGTTYFSYGQNQVYRTNPDLSGWTKIGDVGGRAVSFALGVSPMDLDHLAVAGPASELYITADGGAGWSAVSLSSIPGWLGYNANVAWATDTLLYACSESPFPGSTRVVSSQDGGQTWSAPAAANLPDVPVTKLVVDPNDASGRTVYAATWIGVYGTTDGGDSWSLVGAGLPQVRVSDIYLAPDSSYLRISTWGRGVWELASTPAVGSVQVSPASAKILKGAQQAFTATVAGGGAITWSTSAGSGGTIDAKGNFTATAPGTYTVTATAGSQSASANVLVPPVSVEVAGPGRSILAGETFTFTAQVADAANASVTWSASAGAIDPATGTFTAPAGSSTVTVTATSQDDPTQSGSATFLVAPAAQVALNPDFTSGSQGWTMTDAAGSGAAAPTSFIFTNSMAASYQLPFTSQTGIAFAILGGQYFDGQPHTDTIAQQVSLPGNASGATWTFWENIQTASTSATPVDTLVANVIDAQGSVHTMGQWSNLDASGSGGAAGYTQRSLDLGAFLGQTVTLQLVGSESAAQQTTFLIDNINVVITNSKARPGCDLDGDGTVGPLDLLVIGRDWGNTSPGSPADLDQNGTVGDADLLQFLSNLGH